MRTNRISKMMMGMLLAAGLAAAAPDEERIAFYLPFDGTLTAKTPEIEVEPSSGVVQIEDWSQDVTIGELGKGPKLIEEQGGRLEGVAGDPRVTFEPGLAGQGARLKTMVTYPAPWIKALDAGTITLWYKNPRWHVAAWNVPAMLTPAQAGRAKSSAFQSPLSLWIFDRLTAPPEQGASQWYHWFLDFFKEHPRNISPRPADDNTWHFWALRWDKPSRLLEVIDDHGVRDISRYANLLQPGKDYWEETYRGHVSQVYEDIGHIKFEEIFLGELHLARFCEVSLDEVYVWNRAKSRDELFAAFEQGKAGKPTWPAVAQPKPKRKAGEGLDLTGLDPTRSPLPEAVQWGDTGAFIQETETCRSVCLNGYWRFQPTTNCLTAPDPGQWGYVRIPGDLGKGGGPHRVFDKDFKALKSLEWPGKPVSDVRAFWFERDMDIPATERGRRFFLRYDRFNPSLTVLDLYVNGRFARQIKTYGPGHVDITEWVKAGERNRLAFALAEKTFMPLDLYLESRKLKEISTHDVYMIPKYRDKGVEVRFELENHTGQAQRFEFGAEFAEWRSGKKVRELPFTPLSIGPGEKQTVAIQGQWEHPHAWSIYDPFLYTARVIVKDRGGKVVDVGLPVRFGYRELWSEGGWLYMNGAKTHIRGRGHGGSFEAGAVDYEQARMGVIGTISVLKAVNDYWNRDSRPEVSAYLDTADELGGIACFKFFASGFKETALFAGNPEQQARTAAALKWLRNHPSLGSVILRQSRSFSYGGGDEMEEASWERFREVWDTYAAPLKVLCPTVLFQGFWNAYGDDIANAVGKHSYGLPLQSHEELGRRKWTQGPYQHDKMARVNAECGWPQISRDSWDVTGIDDLTTYYQQYWPNLSQVTEEKAAMYFGDAAYDPTVAVTNAMGEYWRPATGEVARFDWDYVNAIQTVGRPFSRKFPRACASPGWFNVRRLFPDRIIRAWRWYGTGYWTHTEHNQNLTPGPRAVEPTPDTNLWASLRQAALRKPGICVDDGNPRYPGYAAMASVATNLVLSEIGRAVEKQQRPVVAWILGWPDPLRKDHAYYAGSAIRKQIGIMSEYPWPVAVEARWRVVAAAGGGVVTSGVAQVAFSNGDQRLCPLDLRAPVVSAKTAYRIELETRVNDRVVHDDAFAFQVFPEHAPAAISGRIALIDSGATASILETAGIAFTTVTPETDLEPFDLLIIGRKCDQDEVRGLLKQLNIQKHLARGLNVLIFEQEGEVLKRPEPDPWPVLTWQARSDRPELVSFGLKQERQSCRDVFIRDPRHPLFEGLSNEDLADWRGASNLIEPWAEEKWFYPLRGYSRNWREPNMSNLGDVATYVFEKPQSGNFVSLADASFDLLYSALLEERRVNGKTIYCQLNVGNRYGVDPVATLLLDRLVAYALKKHEPPTGKAAFLGNAPWRQAIEGLHFDMSEVTPSQGPDVLKGMQLLMVGVGRPRIEDFDATNRFCGVEAAPAQAGQDPAFDWLNKHKEAVASFVADGGTVFVLPVSAETELAWLPFPVRLEKAKFFAAQPGDCFAGAERVGPADLYYRRAMELLMPHGLPTGSRTTSPAVVARIPWKKGEFIIAQIHPRLFYGDWARTKILRVFSALLTEKGVADVTDIDLTQHGYQVKGFPYCARPLYFDPFLSTSW